MWGFSNEFWKGKRVFITGHTGFKGSWLSIWLLQMGADIYGYALEPYSSPNLFSLSNLRNEMKSEIGDVRNYEQLQRSILAFAPDIIIHMAAQPLVRLSYESPIDTYETNVIGTANLLDISRKCDKLKSVVIVSSDKCYENNEWIWGYRENEPLGGHDPYSSSKACTEIVTSAMRNSFFNSENSANIASVRAGNVIGGGDWSTDRLIPDALKSFENKKPVIIRNPKAIRPWQHVLEPLSGYLLLAEKLYETDHSFNGAWNFGPIDSDCQSVESVLDSLVEKWGDEAYWIRDTNDNTVHEANFLKLDCSKASNRLKWNPKWNLQETLEMIVNWHQNYLKGTNMKKECLKEINKYTN